MSLSPKAQFTSGSLLCWTFCGFSLMYNDLYPPFQCHAEWYWGPKTLWAHPCHLSPARLEPRITTVFPFPKCPTGGTARCVASTHWLRSCSGGRLRCLRVLSRLTARFLLALMDSPLSGWTQLVRPPPAEGHVVASGSG